MRKKLDRNDQQPIGNNIDLFVVEQRETDPMSRVGGVKRQLMEGADIRRNTSSLLDSYRPVFEIVTDVTTVAKNSDFAPKQ